MRKLLLTATALLTLGCGMAFAADDDGDTTNDNNNVTPPQTSTTPGHHGGLQSSDLQAFAQMDTPYGPMVMNVVPSSRHSFATDSKGLVVVGINQEHAAGMAIFVKFDCEKHLFGFLHMFTIKIDHANIKFDEELPISEYLATMTPTNKSPWGNPAEHFACDAHYKLPLLKSGGGEEI